jgi:hypothetical protein
MLLDVVFWKFRPYCLAVPRSALQKLAEPLVVLLDVPESVSCFGWLLASLRE